MCLVYMMNIVMLNYNHDHWVYLVQKFWQIQMVCMYKTLSNPYLLLQCVRLKPNSIAWTQTSVTCYTSMWTNASISFNFALVVVILTFMSNSQLQPLLFPPPQMQKFARMWKVRKAYRERLNYLKNQVRLPWRPPCWWPCSCCCCFLARCNYDNNV